MISTLKKLFGPKNVTLAEPEFREFYLGSRSDMPAQVTPMQAVRVVAVHACVRIISETISSLPLRIYEPDGDGRRVVRTHPLTRLLSTVTNSEQTAMEFREWQMTCLGLQGNSYGQKVRTDGGRIAEIVPLNPTHMHVSRSATGALVFDYQEPGNSRVFRPDELWRVSGLSYDGVIGKSPIYLAQQAVWLALQGEKGASGVFKNASMPSGVLEFEGKLDEEIIEHMRAQFANNYGGADNTGKPLILESGLKYNAVSSASKASEAQFLESRKHQIAEIGRLYRVPLHMLNELDRATFSNIEHQSIEFVMHTIRPWLVRLEQTISRDLLTEAERRRGLYAKHSVEGLLRGDTATRYEAYGKAITDGWLSRNEVRRYEDLNPVPGLDEYVIQMNVDTVDERARQREESISDLAAAEIVVLRREAASRTDADFAAWITKFYDRHQRNAVVSLGQPTTDYAATRLARLTAAQSIAALLDIAESTAVADLEQCFPCTTK